MQGLIHALFSWVHRIEAALMARFKAQPVLTATACLAILALPFLLLPTNAALAVIGIPALPFAAVFAIENRDTEIERHQKRRDQARKDRSARALKKRYGPRRRP